MSLKPLNVLFINKVAKKTPIPKKTDQDEKTEDTPREKTPPPLRFDCPVCDKPYKTLILLQQHIDHCIANS